MQNLVHHCFLLIRCIDNITNCFLYCFFLFIAKPLKQHNYKKHKNQKQKNNNHVNQHVTCPQD